MTKQASLIAPSPAADRFTEIDALRGFALFGILLANLPNWMGIGVVPPDQMAVLMRGIGLENFTAFYNGVLDGKFYTIFSLLFGLGFSLQLERLEKRGADGRAVFMRRMAVLLFFGLFHLSFIWGGDILTLYALLGFTLPLFRGLSDKALLATAAFAIFVVPFAGVALLNTRNPEWIAPLFGQADALWVAAGGNADDDYFDVLKYGGFSEAMTRAGSLWAYNMVEKIENWRIFKVLGTMLVGMWAGRMLLRGQLLENRRLLWSVFLGGLVIALPTLWIYAQQPPHSQTHWASLLGTAPAGFAYAAGFVLLLDRLPALSRILSPVGRMALTNYIATSVVMGFVFYGLGLGLIGDVPTGTVYGMGLLFFGVMIGWSHWWLARYKQGPLEALWRRLTYPKNSAAVPAAA
ncbi:DUF418 domain-containing protein [Aurantiacibacter marinus]|uniref:DUF418 domain-containing protein n=1 Tax=Aurantiacibacter marinus TaxID=874156 RepID=A0A0H0XTJ8_9SPHN|nr:DUF418 domain-containing protein [Aurantiacibacter marinus]KLI63630.1 hypothetical protein AAV99_07765 [Aurantiacibacter marinus]